MHTMYAQAFHYPNHLLHIAQEALYCIHWWHFDCEGLAVQTGVCLCPSSLLVCLPQLMVM